MKNMHGELLDYLSKRMGIYVCDLRLKTYREDIYALLLSLPEDQYTLEEWNYTLDYIMGVHERFGSVSQARIFLGGQLANPYPSKDYRRMHS